MAPRRQEHGWVGGREMGVGGFFFVTARRSRNPRGEKFFEKCLSVHVSNGNLRGEKFFKKFLSAHVVLGAPDRPRYQPKPARNGLFGHHCAKRHILKSFSLHTFPPGTCAKRSFSKSFSPRRFRLRQAVPKRNPNGLPS